MKIKKLASLISLSLLFSSGVIHAQDLTILNGNYESDSIPLEPGYTNFISGWVNSGLGEIGVEFPIDGGVDYTGYTNHGQVAYIQPGGRISQTAPAKILKGETYTLTYDIGRSLDQTSHHFAARFKADGLVLTQSQSNTADIEAGEWVTKTLSFTATEDMPLDKSLVVEFYNLASSASSTANIDNISLSIAGTGTATPITESPEMVQNSVLKDLTLNIPEDFADINLALGFLNNKTIDTNSTVTIQVNNCYTAIYTQPINITHPDSDKVRILGNTVSPSECPLRFTDTNGIVVSDKVELGLIDGFHITGTDAADTSGISAKNGAFVNVGPNIQVTDFTNGFYAETGAFIIANNTVANSNVQGFHSELDGFIQANNTESFSNGHGFHTLFQGIIETRDSDAFLNSGNGYYSGLHSHINVERGNASNNSGRGFISYYLSSMYSPNGYARGNGSYGFDAGYSSLLDHPGSYANHNRNSSHSPNSFRSFANSVRH